MAVSVLECSNDDNLTGRSSRRLARRHYKKDSRFVLDLYTLTYDSHESLDSLGDLTKRRSEANNNIADPTNADGVSSIRNGNSVKSARNTFAGYLYSKPRLQPKFQDAGNNFESCFLGQQLGLFRVEDAQFDDEAFSLPIFTSKPALNTTEVSSLPATENHEITANVVTHGPGVPNDTNDNIDKIVEIDASGGADVKAESNLPNTNGDHPTRWLQELRNEICLSLKKVYSDAKQRRPSDGPITRSIKTSLKKVGVDGWNNSDKSLRLTRPIITKLNSNQLKIIINDLHAHIEHLNEQLMKMLTERDELHMNRDSLLNHIADINAFLDANQVYRKSSVKNCVPNVNYTKNSNAHDPIVTSMCTKNIISGLRLNRLTSYIRN